MAVYNLADKRKRGLFCLYISRYLLQQSLKIHVVYSGLTLLAFEGKSIYKVCFIISCSSSPQSNSSQKVAARNAGKLGFFFNLLTSLRRLIYSRNSLYCTGLYFCSVFVRAKKKMMCSRHFVFVNFVGHDLYGVALKYYELPIVGCMTDSHCLVKAGCFIENANIFVSVF